MGKDLSEYASWGRELGILLIHNGNSNFLAPNHVEMVTKTSALVLKSYASTRLAQRDIFCQRKAMVFSSVIYGWELTGKKLLNRQKNLCWLWCCRRLLRALWLQGDPFSPLWEISSGMFFFEEWDKQAETHYLASFLA